jgi:hypothetical protein
MSSRTKKAPTTSDGIVMFLNYHLFGFFVGLTLSFEREVVTKSLTKTRRAIPRRVIGIFFNKKKLIPNLSDSPSFHHIFLA